MMHSDDEPTLREIADYLRQIESQNYSAALARAEREIAHEQMLLDAYLNDVARIGLLQERGNAY